MENISECISRYIIHISRHYGITLSFHTLGEYCAMFHTNPLLYSYCIHKSPYCTKIKSNSKNRRKCLFCQHLAVKKCETTPSYVGTCHADIVEYIQGIRHKGKVVGMISVSGYQSKNPRFKKDSEHLYLYNTSTKKEPPDEKLLNTIIPPLQYMLEAYLSNYTRSHPHQNKEYFEILNYINENYHNISLDELCNHFSRSKSYISHIFKKNNGQSIRQYANSLKIHNAKILLETTDLSITDIALTCGFNEIGYFVNTFNKIENMSPLQYRKHIKSQ